MKDAVIIGAGLAGLAAAWRLRRWDTQLFEAGERVGGRVHSEMRGNYVLNWGGHMYAGDGSSTQRLFTETGVISMPIPGSLQGMSMNGRFLSTGPVQSYPFRVPMRQRDRLAIMRSGAKLSLDVFRYAAAVRTRSGETPEQRQQRIFDFENDSTFADYLGNVSQAVKDFYYPVVMRSTADPDQIAAGAGIGYFSLIWNIGQGLGNAVIGGASTLTESIAQAMRDRIQLGATVEEVVRYPDHVIVRYTVDGRAQEVSARTVVIATPAPITKRIAVDLPEDLLDTLGQIKYGPHVAGAFLTNENEPMLYDQTYGIATPNRSFTVALNQGNLLHGTRAHDSERQPGGSMMTFSPASLGRKLFDLPEDEIADIHLTDLEDIFPGFRSHVVESRIEKFEFGSPYCFPGRRKLQPRLTRPTERVFLAGDFLGTLYTETAISSGFTAAQRAASTLASGRQSRIAL